MPFQSKVNPATIKASVWPLCSLLHLDITGVISKGQQPSVIVWFILPITRHWLGITFSGCPFLIFNFSCPNHKQWPLHSQSCVTRLFMPQLSSNWCMKRFCIWDVCWKPTQPRTISPLSGNSLGMNNPELHKSMQHWPGYLMLHKKNQSEILY